MRRIGGSFIGIAIYGIRHSHYTHKSGRMAGANTA